jgi:polyhydroxyalkanoate synthesis regulator phasin
VPQPKKTAAAKKPAAARKKPAAARAKAKPAAARAKAKPTATRAKAKPAATRAKAKPAADPVDDVTANLAALRERLVSSVTLTTERLQDAVDDAVRRGRMTRKDAEELLSTLVAAGRAQTEALLADLEQLLGRGSTTVRVRATTQDAGDKVLRTVDRARRRVGVGSPFPILGYDELNAPQIAKRLAELTPAQLRKVRDYERRNGKRKTVLGAIERKLG